MPNFNSLRWSHNTDLTKSNLQHIFDNDKKLYDDLIATNGHTSNFALQEITTANKYTLASSKTFSGAVFSKIYYSVLSVDLTITVPSGTSTLMFGCKALLDGSTGLVGGTYATYKNNNGQVCGVGFGSVDVDSKMDQLYAAFSNYGSGWWTTDGGRKTFVNAICGKTVVDYTNPGAAGEVDFSIFLWSVGKGDVQMIGQDNDSRKKLSNQFWVTIVGKP